MTEYNFSKQFSVEDVLTRLLEVQLALRGLGKLLQRMNEPEDGLCTESETGLGIVLLNLSANVHEVRERLDSCADEGKFVLPEDNIKV